MKSSQLGRLRINTSSISSNVSEWTSEQVAYFVRSLGKSIRWTEYAKQCLEIDIDGATLQDATVDILVELGFNEMDAAKILESIASADGSEAMARRSLISRGKLRQGVGGPLQERRINNGENTVLPLTAKERSQMEKYGLYCALMDESEKQVVTAIENLNLQKEAAKQKSRSHFDKLINTIARERVQCNKSIEIAYGKCVLNLKGNLVEVQSSKSDMKRCNSRLNNALHIPNRQRRIRRIVNLTEQIITQPQPLLLQPPKFKVLFREAVTKGMNEAKELYLVKCTEPSLDFKTLEANERHFESPNMSGWLPLKSSMHCGRCDHAAVMSPDGKKLFVIGGDSGRSTPLNSCEYYDFYTKNWNLLPEAMKLKRSGLGAAISPDGKRLYAVGGIANGSPSNTIEYFDFSVQMWKMLSTPMKLARYGHGVAMGKDGRRLFAVGGFVEGRPANSAEYYDFKTSQWYDLPPMKRCRTGFGIAVSPDGSKIYAVGGCGVSSASKCQFGGRALRTAEVYDFTTCEWTFIPGTLLSKRVNHAVAISPNGNKLYVVGGSPSEQSTPLKGMEVYDFEESKWSNPGPRLKTGRTSLALAISPDGDKLFAVGGDPDGESKDCLDTVECYRLAPKKKTIAQHVAV
mmetsp:Transcript_36148/g.58003  ORF Transcript_36148/g.58003 Transcript_36148/m.58003 type:complete len:631 (-) Transcript_36148:145-2037(-)